MPGANIQLPLVWLGLLAALVGMCGFNDAPPSPSRNEAVDAEEEGRKENDTETQWEPMTECELDRFTGDHSVLPIGAGSGHGRVP